MFGYKYRNNAYKGIKISYVSLKINTSLPLNIKKKLSSKITKPVLLIVGFRWTDNV